MEDSQYQRLFSESVERILSRRILTTDGYLNALRFAWDCQGDITVLQQELHEIEDQTAFPSEALKGPMSSNASPRIYRDGYVKGLKEVIEIILADQNM